MSDRITSEQSFASSSAFGFFSLELVQSNVRFHARRAADFRCHLLLSLFSPDAGLRLAASEVRRQRL